MIAFIDDHRAAYGIEPICRVLPIAASTHRDHLAKRHNPAMLPARAQRGAALAIEARRVFAENFHVFGVRKVWRQLRAPSRPWNSRRWNGLDWFHNRRLLEPIRTARPLKLRNCFTPRCRRYP
jgi:hypothetical protein